MLNVGAMSDGTEVSSEQLRQMLTLIRDNNALGGDRLRVSVSTADEPFLDLDTPAQALGADTPAADGYDGPTTLSLTWDDVDAMIAH